jgi:OOP family OmpA-OmpF porin
MRMRPVRPGPGEAVLPERSILAFDASGSIDRKVLYPTERARVRTFIAGMPPGTYQSKLLVVGGRPEEGLPFEPFDRFRLDFKVQRTDWRGQATPITRLLDELAGELRGVDGKTVLVLWTDGVPTRYGKYIGPDEALAATDRLLEAHTGELCIHTVQVGIDERGPLLLEPMAERSGCGSFHRMVELDSPAAFAALEKSIYIGPAPPPPPPKVRPMTDLDRDGVDDRFDRCAHTPLGAAVDDRGCWVIDDTVFELNSAKIVGARAAPVAAVYEVLARNEGLRVRIDGHTDDVGTIDYNMALSQRRAEAVRDWLVEHGIDGSRLRTRAFGPTRPATSNETPEGRQKNRRVEISVLDY